MAALDLIDYQLNIKNSCEDYYDDYFVNSETYELIITDHHNKHQDDQHQVVCHEDVKMIDEKDETPECCYNNEMIMMDCEPDVHHDHSLLLCSNHIQNDEEGDYIQEILGDVDNNDLDISIHDEFDLQIPNDIKDNYIDPNIYLSMIPNHQCNSNGGGISSCNGGGFSSSNGGVAAINGSGNVVNNELIHHDKEGKLESHLGSPYNSIWDKETNDLDDMDDQRELIDNKKSSSKQDGTLAFLRQCILELKAGIDIIFSPKEYAYRQILWDYLIKISKKKEIQKQPKKKIKFLLIPCLDDENAFEGLNLQTSNIIRIRFYHYIRSKIESNQFINNFFKHRNYGKIDKNGKELNPIVAEKKILNTLQQYFEELKKPSRFRGLYSDVSYSPDVEWIRKIENKN